MAMLAILKYIMIIHWAYLGFWVGMRGCGLHMKGTGMGKAPCTGSLTYLYPKLQGFLMTACPFTCPRAHDPMTHFLVWP